MKFGGSNSWQPKYFLLRKQGNIPYLEYHNKKPKNKNAIPRGKIPLRPSFRVEKSMNAKNRAYVFEVITPARHLCLSADEQKIMDLFVFYLQSQVRLSGDVIDDYFIVEPENSEAHRRIGSRGTCCIFHIAPWGIDPGSTTSEAKAPPPVASWPNSRAVLAQWPLKCIRCYESNSNGQFILEAGRIAPMGDGVYVFNTRPGEDNAMYDLLDKYVLAATAALKGRHPNNQEQFHDLQLERDRLNALTTVSTDTSQCTELSQATLQNYNHRAEDFTEDSLGQETVPHLVTRAPPGGNDTESLGYLHPITSRAAPQSLQLTNEMFLQPRSADPNCNVLAARPPVPAPFKSQAAKSASEEKAALGISDMDSVDGYFDMRQSTENLNSTLSRSISVTPMSPSNKDWFPPPSFGEATQVSGGSYAGIKVNSVFGSPPRSVQQFGPVLPKEDQSYLNPRASEVDDDSLVSEKKSKPPLAPRAKNKDGATTSPHPRYRMMRLKSRSCEDMSDFHTTIYMNRADVNNENNENDGKTTPEPFNDLDPFENKQYATEPRAGRRFVKKERTNTSLYDPSTLPASQLPQYYNHNNNTKQPYLGRSVSNPNFFDLESKDIITKRDKSLKSTSLGKSPTRSLASLLPGALKRHLSRENNASGDGNESLLEGERPRSRSNSLRLRSNSVTKSSSDLPSASNFVRNFRRSSFGSKDSISASIKGITMSEKSRSFRKHKSVDSNLNRQTSELSDSVSPTSASSPPQSRSPGATSPTPIKESVSPTTPSRPIATVSKPNVKPRVQGLSSRSPNLDSSSPGVGSSSSGESSRSRGISSRSPGASPKSHSTLSSSKGMPSRSRGLPWQSEYANGHMSPQEYDSRSLPVRRKNFSVMAGRRLPSLPDEKKTETAC
ncbi:uncharacterized protein LOC135480937 [Liolophura sinensis]|uniref:uncharacterized protein LOC135480937 n=1 Tax=Liolophura sinensis TaxID=3198878 RepID=UPI003158EB22